ncbi:DUF389-containing protein [Fragilaria crotonensis]|nr:DUF389-containing protein [Fragilaria crotonensis]
MSDRTENSDDSRAPGTGGRNIRHRNAVIVNVAQPEDVESTPEARSFVRASDIVKIFVGDDEIAEVTMEQVQRVKMMHERMEEGVNFSFNFNTLLLIASILAGLGLVSNSSATIIASMLVSPLMGPVIGLAYGTTIGDWKLVRLSIRNELICLVFCIIVGMIIAGILGPTSVEQDWPTTEMSNRGTMENFLVGLPIAFFSGLGVAVSLLDDQTSSLVGVAISASLLPPAVNAGILWIAHVYTKMTSLTTICMGWCRLGSQRQTLSLFGLVPPSCSR